MIQDVCQLLDRYHHANANFCVCVSTDYTTDADASLLLGQGHERGNHMHKDTSNNYYCHPSQSQELCEKEPVEVNRQLEHMIVSHNRSRRLKHNMEPSLDSPSPRILWFRAPQGRMLIATSKVLEQHGMTNVMGDVYCDDWAFGEAVDGHGRTFQLLAANRVAELMLQQVQSGSIAIFHMPEKNFREAGLFSLEKILQGCYAHNLRCVTMSELMVRRHSPLNNQVPSYKCMKDE